MTGPLGSSVDKPLTFCIHFRVQTSKAKTKYIIDGELNPVFLDKKVSLYGIMRIMAGNTVMLVLAAKRNETKWRWHTIKSAGAQPLLFYNPMWMPKRKFGCKREFIYSRV